MTHSAHKTVLLVDDDPDFLGLLAGYLQAAIPAAQILTARCAEEAERILHVVSIDIVISDHHMPGADGATLLRAAAQLVPHAVLFSLTGAPTAEHARQGQASGFRVLAKPIDPAFLAQLLTA